MASGIAGAKRSEAEVPPGGAGFGAGVDDEEPPQAASNVVTQVAAIAAPDLARVVTFMGRFLRQDRYG
jgi:hypothetical protein